MVFQQADQGADIGGVDGPDAVVSGIDKGIVHRGEDRIVSV